MRVAVVGATGFIGRAVVAALLANGREVLAIARDADAAARRFPALQVYRLDLARPVDKAALAEALAGVDAAVNCAGVLERDADAVHVRGAGALFEACRTAGVGHIVHVSAVGVDGPADTDFARTKRAADEMLVASAAPDWTILRPSLVYGGGAYGGTALLRGLAAFPLAMPLPGAGDQRFSPIHLDDLCRAIDIALTTDRTVGRILEPAGPETVTLLEIVRRLRAWLDLPPAPALHVPMPLVRSAAHVGRLLRLGPINPTALRQIEAGADADGAAFAAAIGFRPMPMAEALARRPSSGQDRRAARVYFLRPAMAVLAAASLLLALWSAWAGVLFAAAGLAALCFLFGTEK